MMTSGKIIVSIYSNSFSLERISFMGLDNVFFPIAQIPTITLGPEASFLPSLSRI
jgi:hypothetical protein